MSKENAKGIVCSIDEVRAILDGKTQFREVLKPQNKIGFVDWIPEFKHQVGDMLRVVEEYEMCMSDSSEDELFQKDTDIFQKVTAIRVEKLQDMKTSDMLKEGVSEFKNYEEFRGRFSPHDTKEFVNGMFKIKEQFIKKWNSEHKDGEKWADNPYVIVEDRERVE